jgi:hypothetical protein
MDINHDFLERLEACLRALPSPTQGQNRNLSWMAAREIKEALGLDMGSDALDSLLLASWESGGLGKIRPAKYPHETNLFRLWGHEDVVGIRDRSEIEPRRLETFTRFDPLVLPDSAPEVFLSFSSHDVDLAQDLRFFLGKQKIRTWMYQAVPSRELIVEAVRGAIERCHALVVLLTCNSLGSAWVYSEVHFASLEIRKPIWAIVDGQDSDLIQLVRAFDPEKSKCLPQDAIAGLKQKYARVESNLHRLDVYDTVLNDQLITIRYMYSRASFFPPQPDSIPGFSDINGVAGWF